MPRFLFLSPYPTSAPSHRVRIEQYVPYLERRGATVVVRSLVDDISYRARGPRLMGALLAGTIRRIRDVASAGMFDAVLVHREALPLPTAALERLLDRVARRLVFDFDDAIYLPQPYPALKLLAWIRSPRKFGAMVTSADEVLAGNQHLAKKAAPFARHVSLLPTTVDTDRIVPASRPAGRERVVIGWIGSTSTARYLEPLREPLAAVLQRYPNVEFRTIGGALGGFAPGRATWAPWSLDREVADLQGFDIGIMPMPDDEWTRGKCGYKALQYMSAGVATVSSPVGVATEMIEHGRTGLLASSTVEWIDSLSTLVADRSLRWGLALSARAMVEDRYSVSTWSPRFYDALNG